MVGNPVKELNIPKTLVLRERGHVTTVKFRDMSGADERERKVLKGGLGKHLAFLLSFLYYSKSCNLQNVR